MKNYIKIALLLAGTSLQTFAANTVTKVTQVTEPVTVSADVDYTITSDTPFATAGTVNITNTEHAVVIIQSIKPSVVISKWLGNVQINGVQAKDGVNCQVKMYGYGAIIFPYANNIKPLTVYSAQDFKGTAVNDFGLENTGGFMNTLTDAKLNNQIRSFKLKRGYMVTFSTRAGGRGYSRCFIADKEDLEVSSLPLLLDQTISSYRVFHWYNAKKAGLASDTRFESNNALNSSWCYSWGTGESRLPDTECVPNHIYEDWPSASACGNVTYSCHMKTNNEPGNSADDHPQDVATVLANWENLMRTGLRLCSESSHDGSMNHLKAFMDSIDARGWRCDILDLHCYWQSGTFNNLNWYSSNYGNGRPIWISEWVWGASWNHNGFWGAVSDAGSLSESNQQTLYNGTKPILDVLNSNSKVERYAYWNSEAPGTHIYDGGISGGLTTLGKYYAKMGEGLGYNPANEFIPKRPPMKNTGDLVATYDKETGKANLKWRDYNGEYNKSMVIQQQELGKTTWSTVKTVTQKETEAVYNEAIECKDGTKFRIVITVPSNSTSNSTTTLTGNSVTARSANMQYGDEVTVIINDVPETRYLGGNKFINGDFSMGTTDWLAADGKTIAAPYFQVMPEGGVSGSPYLQCYGKLITVTSPQCIVRATAIEPNTAYYVGVSGINLNSTNVTYQLFQTTKSGSSTGTTRLAFTNSSKWSDQSAAFYNVSDANLNLKLVSLAGKAQVDNVMLCQLFDTKEAALADALAWEKKRVETFIAYNTVFPAVNSLLTEALNSSANANDLEQTLTSAIDVIKAYKEMGHCVDDAQTIINHELNGYLDTKAALEAYTKAVTPGACSTFAEITAAINALEDAVAQSLPYNLNTTIIQNGSFAATTGWTTKSGTYTDGDQRTATQAGKTCWNAWWSISVNGNEDKTMAIKQDLKNMDEGLYALECLGTTQHFCENDQHAYINYGGKEIASENLDFGNLDVTTFSNADMWRPMSTPFVYVKQGDSFTVGFTGSKKGCVDKSWMKYADGSTSGDNREGWWCATDFKLRFIPTITKETEGEWGIVCFPYKPAPQDGVTLYNIAGISNDKLHIYIKPAAANTLAEGRAYIYHTNGKSKVIFTGSGTRATSAKTYLALKGTLAGSTVKYGTSSVALVNGRWIYNPGTTTVVPSNYGYIQFISSISTKVDKAPEGTIAMPLVGYSNSLLGDANDDGKVDMADALAIQAYYVGTEGVTINLSTADYNGDGEITVADANAIVNLINM